MDPEANRLSQLEVARQILRLTSETVDYTTCGQKELYDAAERLAKLVTSAHSRRNWRWEIEDVDSTDMLVSNCPELQACIWQDEQNPIGAQFRISVYWQGESNLLVESTSACSIWRALEIAEAICERALDTIPTTYAAAGGASEF